MGNDNSGNDEKVKYEEVGRNAAKDLASDWNSSKGGCTDRHLQDQLILFMALAKGKSKMATCAMELHTETAKYIAQLLTGAKFKTSQRKDGTLLIECDGIGYSPNQKGKKSKKKKNKNDDANNEEKSHENDSSKGKGNKKNLLNDR